MPRHAIRPNSLKQTHQKANSIFRANRKHVKKEENINLGASVDDLVLCVSSFGLSSCEVPP